MKTLRSMTNTYIYKIYDKSLNLNDTILKIMDNGTVLDWNTDLNEYINIFDRRYMFPLKNKTINDVKNSRVLPIFCKNSTIKLPNTIPFFLVNTGKGINAIANLSNFTTVDRSESYNIDPKILYSLLQGASISATCYQKYSSLKNKANILKIGSYVYATLFTKTINKMYSLNITPAKTDMMMFLSSMFFLTNVIGRDEDSYEDTNIKFSLEHCKAASKLLIDDIIRKFDFKKDCTSLETFINAIASNISGLESITARGFSEQYISMYGPNMILSIECLPIFIWNLGCVQVGSYLNNQNSIENIVGKEIDKFIAEFATL